VRPFVWLNCAASLDGKIALPDRRQLRISNREDMVRVQRLRAASDAVLVGLGTVLQDDPHLTVKREYAQGPHPLRVVLDTRGGTPPGALVLNNTAPTLIVTGDAAANAQVDAHDGARPGVPIHAPTDISTRARTASLPPHVEVLPCGDGEIDLVRLLDCLGARGVRQLLVEGGTTVHWSFLNRGLADRLTLFVGSLVIGGSATPTVAGGSGAADAAAVRRMHLATVERLGDGALLTYERE